TFVDNDRVALRLLRRNAALLGEGERVTIVAVDATRLGPAPRPPARLALLDPPYGRGLAAGALTALAQGGWLAEAAIVVVELGAGEPFTPPPGFLTADERRYGTTRLVFLCWSP
ncbi:MAG: RsmD family RNA methyltransferase, partial [Alphaproteobacteria bacterium]